MKYSTVVSIGYWGDWGSEIGYWCPRKTRENSPTGRETRRLRVSGTCGCPPTEVGAGSTGVGTGLGRLAPTGMGTSPAKESGQAWIKIKFLGRSQLPFLPGNRNPLIGCGGW